MKPSMRHLLVFPVTLFLTLPAMAEPLLKNGGFDKELAPWECDEGKVVADLGKMGNSVLQVVIDGGVFGLAQDFRWPAGKKTLTLSFRVKADAASKDSPIQWRLRLYDAQGNSALSAGGKIEKSGEWITVTKKIERPEGVTSSLMLESNRGEGKLWIDDLKLE